MVRRRKRAPWPKRAQGATSGRRRGDGFRGMREVGMTREDGGVTLFFVPLLGQDIDFFYFIIRGSHPLAARKTCHPVERPLPPPG